MPGYQPRLFTDHVWVNGTDIHTYSKSTGLGVRVTEMRGWDDRPEIRDSRDLRMGQDGEYANNLYLGGRTISIAGAVHGSSWEDLQTRKRALAAVFVPSSTEVLLKVPDPATASPTGSYSTTGMTGYERVSCRVVEPIMFGDMIGSAAMTWQVVVRASDPRVYSDVETSTDSGTTGTAARTVTVDQSGTYDTPPTITVTGPTASTWSVSEPSSGLSLSMTGLALNSSESVVFDTSERSIDYSLSYERGRTTYSGNVTLWMLDETSGTTADNIQGTATYDGTYTGGYTLNQSGFVSGIQSVSLNGTTGYVSIPYNAAMATTAFSVEGWFKATTLGGTLVSHRQSGAGGWSLDLSAAGVLTFTMYTGAGATNYSVVTGAVIQASTWYHIAVIRGTIGSQQQPVILINGASSSSLSATPSGSYSVPTSQGINIGRLTTGSSYFSGNVCAVAYYNTRLSEAQIADLYTGSADTSTVNGYSYLVAESAAWANLGTASSTYTLASSGLNTGSKLNVKYRDARL